MADRTRKRKDSSEESVSSEDEYSEEEEIVQEETRGQKRGRDVAEIGGKESKAKKPKRRSKRLQRKPPSQEANLGGGNPRTKYDRQQIPGYTFQRSESIPAQEPGNVQGMVLEPIENLPLLPIEAGFEFDGPALAQQLVPPIQPIQKSAEERIKERLETSKPLFRKIAPIYHQLYDYWDAVGENSDDLPLYPASPLTKKEWLQFYAAWNGTMDIAFQAQESGEQIAKRYYDQLYLWGKLIIYGITAYSISAIAMDGEEQNGFDIFLAMNDDVQNVWISQSSPQDDPNWTFAIQELSKDINRTNGSFIQNKYYVPPIIQDEEELEQGDEIQKPGNFPFLLLLF